VTETNQSEKVDASSQTQSYIYVDASSQTQSYFYVDVNTQTATTQITITSTQTTNENEMSTTMILNEKIEELEQQLARLQHQNEKIESGLFNCKRFLANDTDTNFYTGFPSAKVFMAVYKFFDEGQDGSNIKYWLSSSKTKVDSSNDQDVDSVKKGAGRPRTLKPIDEFFLVMCRLRQGFPVNHLGHLFNISQSTASRIIITWINYMYLTLGSINIWPSRQIIDNTMPEAFKAQYSSTRVIIEMRSSLHLNGELFSSYKNHTTLKDLVGISPGGAITFVSQLYTGCISDR